MAGEVGAELCLVVDLVPHHGVHLSGGAGRADGEDEPPVPRHDQKLQHLQETGVCESVWVCGCVGGVWVCVCVWEMCVCVCVCVYVWKRKKGERDRQSERDF